ncbi:7321_t:CDS:10 [Diversispora eburnea]|uniref:DNA topoisomerase n=1 Tax=Diversispora eburnea TaxID=1213867 RepID=A0A9N8UVN5_9GLOM|nr:7321_t:CDS:10 [Diversispora eburnea]
MYGPVFGSSDLEMKEQFNWSAQAHTYEKRIINIQGFSVDEYEVFQKPSLAEAITKLLAPGGQNFAVLLLNINSNLLLLDFDRKHNNWDIDPILLFDASTVKQESSKSICRHLQQESKDVDYVVLWLDCDREGENICFEVIDNVRNNMKSSPGETKESRILRAKFSAITKVDIRRAMDNLIYPNKNEALAVDARQELDLKIGCAFTRFQTRFFQGKYGNLDSSVISYGPCQTPTLSFCVSRYDQIQSFSPESYWSLAVTVANNEQDLNVNWERARVFDKQVTNLFLDTIKDFKEAKVVSVNSVHKTRSRPHALNTVELLKFGSSYLGIGPNETMSIAERLYIQGYVSYPRTETTTYSKNFDIYEVLRTLSNHSSGIEHPSGGTDVGDHPPITPMKVAHENIELFGDSWKVYNYITRHFLGSVSSNQKYLKTNVIIKIGDENFETSGTRTTEPGFTTIMNWHSKSDKNIPDFRLGEILKVKSIKIAEGQTSPPDYLTESEVISLMEKHGIGTDASIPVHINNIYLSLPTMRSDVEKQLNYIANGQANHSEVLEHSINLFRAKFKYFREKIELMDELFEATFSPLAATGKVLSKCGKCKRPQRLHCPNCSETYSLPQNGSIKLYKELRCPLDDFELVLFSTGSKSVGYPLCPYCYNHPPFEDARKVCSCQLESCNGQMVLDATSAPRWKLSCNGCVSFLKDETCDNEDCSATILKIEYLEKQNKKPIEGCIMCDEEVSELLDNKIGIAGSNNNNRGGWRRGRRGGRRGRGRGGHRRGRGNRRGGGRTRG